ncbi:MAG: OmpA family protein [Leptonema sp. (in: Bacteria)]|nr:OmpA family protein [Leptonema sp. (in: bacteria)]
MNKKWLLSTAMLILAFGFASCSSGQTTEGGSDNSSNESSSNRSFDMVNMALSQLSYSPNDNKGWDYKATGVPAADFQKWATKNKSTNENAQNEIGDGYVLQVTGHTDSTGPRDRQADGRLGNLYYSKARADSVVAAFRNAGIPVTKIKAAGVADDELLSGLDSKDQKNRRVTFKIVPKAN